MKPRYISNLFLGAIIIASFFVFPFVLAKTTTTSSTTIEMQKSTTSTPIIIILPHQDDELFMAGAIQQYQKSGRKVHVIMVSDGGSSAVRHILNGKDDKGNLAIYASDKKPHNPLKEGYSWFTRQRFSAARNREFIRSMKELGIAKSQIEFMNPGKEFGSANPIYRDGDLQKTSAKAIALMYKKYGDGTYVTLSGGHPDHVALEDALFEAIGISEKIFFPFKYDTAQDHITLSEDEMKKKQKAVDAYGEWKPREGKFAIGKLSVNGLMDTWRQQVKEYFYSLKIN